MSLRRKVTAADGRKISYLIHGDGPTLLVIPALLQTAENWESLGYVDRFTSTNRVIVIDPLGHGHSDVALTPDAYAPEIVVAHIVAVLEQEGVESAVIWGYGSGAEAALLTARRRPDIFHGVIVGGMYLGDAAERSTTPGDGEAESTERVAATLDRGAWEEYFDMVSSRVPDELRDDYEAQNNPAVVAAMTRAGLLWPRGFLMPAAPTLAYWAELDAFAVENARLSESLPIDRAVIPGGHHEAFLAVDRVAAAVSAFVDTIVRV